MIKVYPIKIEAVDEDDELIFTMECFDEKSASLHVKSLICNDNLEDFIAAIRRGVTLLDFARPGEPECGDG